MNGRVYDPSIGKFLSADPFIQFPESTQGFNRYAYVGNNPLSYNDPSGHFLGPLQVVMLAYSTAQGMKAGGIKGALAGFVLAGASAAAANAIGGMYSPAASFVGPPSPLTFAQFATKAFLHGATQGAISSAGGGRFGDGFLGAAAGSLAEPLLSAMEPGVLQATAAVVVGGTASRIGGGNFANGAITSSFVYAFNYLNHQTLKPDRVVSGEERFSVIANANEAELETLRNQLSAWRRDLKTLNRSEEAFRVFAGELETSGTLDHLRIQGTRVLLGVDTARIGSAIGGAIGTDMIGTASSTSAELLAGGILGRMYRGLAATWDVLTNALGKNSSMQAKMSARTIRLNPNPVSAEVELWIWEKH